MAHIIKKIAVAMIAGTVLAGSAHAGGFGRGTADTDIIYEDGGFSMRSGLVFVAPQRDFDTVDGESTDDGVFTNSYVIPNGAIKLNITESARCAGTFTQVYGASSSFGEDKLNADRSIIDIGSGPIQTSNATESLELSVDELGLTCGYGVDAGPGTAWILGGVFLEKFFYEENTDFGLLTFNGDYTPGFRVGAAYEIPEIALRAQLLYRSAVDHTPGGTYAGFVPDGTGGFILAPSTYSVIGEGTTPQSVELKVQSGVAAGTLVFGSVKWTDWSVIDTLDYTIAGVVPNQNEYFWKDGWTVSGGVGRQFSEMLSGQASLTWDQGVSTTEDMLTDTWTVGAGLRMAGDRGAISLGGAVSYLTSGSQSVANGAEYDATVGNDIAYAVGGNFLVNF